MPESSQVPALVVPRPERLRRERTIFALAIVVPALGTVAAFASLPWLGVTALDAGLLIGLFVVTVLGIEVGYHRLFSHNAFEARPAVRGALAIAGAFAVQGPVLYWASHHRHHHRFSDSSSDVHTPHGFGPGFRGALRGLWHAHVGWIFQPHRASAGRYCPDLLADSLLQRIDARYSLWLVLSFVGPAAVGLAVTGSGVGALRAGLWGGAVRIFLVQQGTYGINSICHVFGTRPFATHDRSTNNAWLAPLSLGGSWHNNHHAFPSSAFNSIDWWHVDPAGGVIRLLSWVGLTWNVKRPSARAIELKRARGTTSPEP